MIELTPQTLTLGLMWYLVFLVSTVCHEAAHAWIAFRGGDPTAALGGQASLNPVPHLRREPIGMIVVPAVLFLTSGWMLGWASAPYDPRWAWRHPRRAAWMSFAGPLANLALAALAFGLLRAGLAAGIFAIPDSAGYARVVTGEGIAGSVGAMLSILLMLNVILGVFNLLPIPPLDGHAVVPLLLSDDAGRRWQETMRSFASGFGIAGLVIAWLVFGKLLDPIFRLVLGLVHPGTTWS